MRASSTLSLPVAVEKPVVAAVSCPNYDLDRVRGALQELLAPLGGMRRFVRPGQRVLVKPNLLSARPPEDAVTTHPAVVQAVVEAVQEAGGLPFLGDAPGARTSPGSLHKAYTLTGLADVAARTGTPLNFDVTTAELPNPEGRRLRQIPVWRAVCEAEVLISLPKLKTHNLTGLTGAVKNCFGLIPSPQKTYLHMRWARPDEFSEMLVDLYLWAKPALNILDAVVGMEGDGPSAGRPRPIGALLASTDGLALDVAMATLVGYDPMRVTTIAAAMRRGLSRGRLEDLTWVGPPLQELRPRRFRPSIAWLTNSRLVLWIMGLGGNFTTPRPKITGACIGCGVCAEHCPVNAITLCQGQAVVDHGKCIRCFCCHELCPQQAVEIHRPGLADWLVRLLTR